MRRDGSRGKSDRIRGILSGFLILSMVLLATVPTAADPLLTVRKNPSPGGEVELRWTGSQSTWNHIIVAATPRVRDPLLWKPYWRASRDGDSWVDNKPDWWLLYYLVVEDECGDGFCTLEDAVGCPDCEVGRCGDSVCQSGETRVSCPFDCGSCGNNSCEPQDINCPWDCTGDPCGNGQCDPGEDPTNCRVDCPPGTCGNNLCESAEECQTCAADCSTTCGDGTCESPCEDEQNCASDCCTTTCGDGVCERPCENSQVCASDCEPLCGDGYCDIGGAENPDTCPDDCPRGICGNNLCEGTHECECEDACQFADSQSCQYCCDYGFLGASACEAYGGCNCNVSCGNGVCDRLCWEFCGDSNYCEEDCFDRLGLCGNGICDMDECENSSNCPQDCP